MRARLSSIGRACAELAREAGFEACGLRARQLREHPRVEAERDRADTDQHEDSEDLADALARAERLLHPREHLAADEQGERERGRGAERISEQQQGGAEARALERGGGEDDPEDRPRARRPQQAGRDPEDDRGPDALLRAAGLGALRQARAERDDGAGEAVGDLREDEGDPEQGEQDQRRPAADFVGAHRPAAADRRERRDRGEGHRHSGEQGQGAAGKAAVGAREHERQHRQDAGADNGQHAAQIGKKDDQHEISSGRGGGAAQHAVHRVSVRRL